MPSPRLQALGRCGLQYIVRHSGRPSAVIALAAVSAADYLVPVLPNEGLAVSLAVLQPRRARLVAWAFAIASAIGAGAMGLLLLGLVDGAQRLGLETFGEDWDRLMAYVRQFGPATMLLAAVFPSPPRAMVAATVLSGVPVAVVMGAVLAGKLAMYACIFRLLGSLPAWARSTKVPDRLWLRAPRRVLRRLFAYRRWVTRAAITEEAS
jgi:membrane protein YqaA with SNARE-associated domain